jgi:hypothetical protein
MSPVLELQGLGLFDVNNGTGGISPRKKEESCLNLSMME